MYMHRYRFSVKKLLAYIKLVEFLAWIEETMHDKQVYKKVAKNKYTRTYICLIVCVHSFSNRCRECSVFFSSRWIKLNNYKIVSNNILNKLIKHK